MKHHLLLSTLLFSILTAWAQQPKDSLNSVQKNQDYLIEKLPAYPGGAAALNAFISKSIDPMVPEQNGAPAGHYKVIIDFVVDKDGAVKDLKPLTSYGYGMEEEAIKVIQKSSPWQAGVQRGKTVNTFMRLPITFKVELKGMIISNSSHEKYILYEGVENELAFTPIGKKEEGLIISIDRGTLKDMDNKNNRKNIYVDEPAKPVIMTISSKKGYLQKIYFEVLPEKKAPLWLKRV